MSLTTNTVAAPTIIAGSALIGHPWRLPPPALPLASKSLERDDRAGVLDAWDTLHLLVDEMADVGAALDIEFDQQVKLAGRRINLGRNLSVGELVRHLI